MPAVADHPPQQQQQPAPAPTPEPQATPQPSSIEAFDDQFKDLDHTPDPEPPPKPEPQPAPKADVTPKDVPKPDKPDAAPKEAVKDEPENFEPPQVAKPNELRGWALRMGKKAKDVTERLVEVQKKLDEALKRPAPQAKPDPALTKRLADAEAKLQEYESTLRITNYERSQEYKDKFEKPINVAQQRAKREVESLTIEQRQKDPESGEEKVVSSRQATWNDFANIYNMTRPQARKVAKELFGEDADLIMRHFDSIHELYENAYVAVEEYKTKGKEQEAQTEAEKKREADFMEQGWEKANAAFIAKSPQDFDERPDDVAGNELLNKARSFVDLFMSDEREKYPLPQRILADARVRNWAAAYPRAQRDIKQLRAELEQANATISQLRGSGPGKPTSPDGQQAEQPETLQQAFDRMVPA